MLKRPLVHLTIVMALSLGEQVASAQSRKDCVVKKDTVSIFGNRLKIALPEGAFERIPADVCTRKYAGIFNLHDVTNSSSFVLRSKDTLVFYATSMERANQNDGGISTWHVINSFLDKTPAYRMESGWKKMDRDYLYYVRLILGKEPDHFFEFNFFFIENKLMFSLLERQVKELPILENESFTLVSPR